MKETYKATLNNINKTTGYIQVGASYFKASPTMLGHAEKYVGRKVKIEYVKGEIDLVVKSISAAE